MNCSDTYKLITVSLLCDQRREWWPSECRGVWSARGDGEPWWDKFDWRRDGSDCHCGYQSGVVREARGSSLHIREWGAVVAKYFAVNYTSNKTLSNLHSRESQHRFHFLCWLWPFAIWVKILSSVMGLPLAMTHGSWQYIYSHRPPERREGGKSASASLCAAHHSCCLLLLWLPHRINIAPSRLDAVCQTNLTRICAHLYRREEIN